MNGEVFVRCSYGKKETPRKSREFVKKGTYRPVGCITEITSYYKDLKGHDYWLVFEDHISNEKVGVYLKDMSIWIDNKKSDLTIENF